MIYKLDGKLRLGKKHELFKKGNITKKPDGTFDVQLAIVCTADDGIPKSEPNRWSMEISDSGVKIGISKGINMPMCSINAKLEGEPGAKPLDSFKMKVNLTLDGWAKIYCNFKDSMWMVFEITGKNASDFTDGKLSLSQLGIEYEVLKDITPEIIPDEDIPDEEKPGDTKPVEVKMNIIQKGIKWIKDFIVKNKWYFIGGYIIGVIILMITNSILGISLAFVMGIIAGILI